jgi:hypothetical protein
MGAGRDRGHPLVDQRRGVGHHPDHRDARRDVALDVAGGDAGGEADQDLPGAQVRGDLGEDVAHVLRLHHQRDGVGPGRRLGVGDHLHVVLLAELGSPLGTLLTDHQVLERVSTADQAGEQRLAHHAGTDDRNGHGGFLLRRVRAGRSICSRGPEQPVGLLLGDE